ncbi:MAG: Asp-tRNA(Asn)/Glu-tRNA(Gln) amidotransferase subunit GatA [Bacteroidia bacterium]|jgi:aspartyl-tRNA(Asn)/glutamyl-tRNA(Gln) amidotransferase subunit A|nr:Asp-tRNA(Asn)/Glu-tRNA(Gln) amidotransferase subunit GatA [Bacteroidia bacterium]
MSTYSFKSIATLQSDLRSGHISAETLVKESLNSIANKKHLNAFLEVFAESALQQAKAVDEKLKKNKAGKLAGVIVGLKDNICYKGHKVSASSKILEGFESLYSATVVERLLAEDAIIIGRLNCDEFAMGSSNENSAYGPVLNPLDEKRVPGGSSGGAAAAVAATLCHVSLGSDTGGSIRQPASFTGTVGLKPTYGRVSRYGLIAYASSFDQIGPITHSVEDAALVLEVISGKDAHDNTSSSETVPAYSSFLKDDTKYKIACIKECIEAEGLDPDVKQNVLKQLENFKKAGHQVEMISFPYLEYLVPTYYVLTTAEASSNLSRFSGIHYGHRSEKGSDLESTYKKSRSEGFGAEVKRRIMLGTFVLSAGYYDAYYSKGQKVRRVVQEKTLALFKDFDCVVTPSTPGTAFEFGKNSADPIKMYLEDIFTVQANIAGVPAISVPSGKASNGLPTGIQLMCDYFHEAKLLNLAQKIQAQ